jgi:hypothetical protein
MGGARKATRGMNSDHHRKNKSQKPKLSAAQKLEAAILPDGAPELLMLSMGLPPPELVLPDFADSASAVALDVLVEAVLLVDDAVALGELDDFPVVASVDGLDADNMVPATTAVEEPMMAVWLGAPDDVSKSSELVPLALDESDDRTIVLGPIEADCEDTFCDEAVVMAPAALFCADPVDVTTATLHSTWMP